MSRLSPYVFVQEMDNSGNPLSGGKIYTYAAGTTTPQATYTDSTGTTPNANPIILNSAGRADIWLGQNAYKFVLKDSSDNTIKTVDNVAGDSASGFGSNVVTQATNLAITSAYKNNAIVCTAALTLTLDTCANLGGGFYFSVVNTSAGNVTIQPDATNTIQGASSFIVYPGQSALVITNGTVWNVFFNEPFSVTAGTLTTFPSTSQTLVGRTSTDTLTNKTYDTAGTGNSFKINGTSITAVQGTGAVVLATSQSSALVSNAPPGAAFKNLSHAWASNTTVSISCDEIALKDGSSNSYLALGVSLTLNTATSGANGLDTGATAANTWYSLWIIYNGTTVACLMSTSSTAPTMPGAYTYKARIGWIRLDGSKNIIGYRQLGRQAQYIVGSNLSSFPTVASGNVGASPVAASISAFVPPTASRISLMGSYSANTLQMYANANANSYFAFWQASSSFQTTILLESTNVYWRSDNAGNSFQATSWEDNI